MCGSPGSHTMYPGKFQSAFFTEIFTSLILHVQHCFSCRCDGVMKQLKERRLCFGSQLEGTGCRGPKGLEPRVRGCRSHWIQSGNKAKCWCSMAFVFSLLQSGAPSQSTVPLKFRTGSFHSHTIPELWPKENPLKVTVKINHHQCKWWNYQSVFPGRQSRPTKHLSTPP